MEFQDKSLKDEIRELKEAIIDKKENKVKPFWLPFKARVGKKRAEKGWTTVLKINDNRTVTFEKQQIEEQTMVVDGAPRIATPDEVLTYKGRPFVIQPSWSVKPFSPTDNLEETQKLKYSAAGYRLLLNRMKNEAISTKKAISGWLIGGGILVLIVLGYMASKGGLFK